MAEINFNPICKKIEQMIKKELKDGGHKKSGHLEESIKVTYSNEVFSLVAEDYFTKLDEKYGISDAVLNSDELITFIENYLAEQTEKQIE